nr:hypothetical protein [Tanacetum cinerariifolium]
LDGDDDDDDFDKESIISTNTDIFETPSFDAITTTSPIEEPKDSLIIEDDDLNTIPEKLSDEFIKSSVEDLVPIPRKTMTFSTPLFNSDDDFTSSDDESLFDKDVLEDNMKIYSSPLFEFNDEYISSDVNSLFDEVLENIENKDSYDSDLDEPDLLVTPLFDANKNECFNSGGDDDEINVLDCEDSYYDSEGDILYLESFLNDDLVHHDPSIPAISVASILEGFTNEPPLEVNDDLSYLKPKNDDWKKIFFFIISSIAVQTPGCGISNLLAVGTTFTGSGNLYCQWELSPGSRNALGILFSTYSFTCSNIYNTANTLQGFVNS